MTITKQRVEEIISRIEMYGHGAGYATSNLSGAYNMFSEFWNVAVSAAPKVDDL